MPPAPSVCPYIMTTPPTLYWDVPTDLPTDDVALGCSMQGGFAPGPVAIPHLGGCTWQYQRGAITIVIQADITLTGPPFYAEPTWEFGLTLHNSVHGLAYLKTTGDDPFGVYTSTDPCAVPNTITIHP